MHPGYGQQPGYGQPPPGYGQPPPPGYGAPGYGYAQPNQPTVVMLGKEKGPTITNMCQIGDIS